jgi:CBS-domain-containing membrane protein
LRSPFCSSSDHRKRNRRSLSNNLPWSFLFAPVLAGAVLLTVFGYVWHRWIRRRRWQAFKCPQRDRAKAQKAACAKGTARTKAVDV